MRRPLSKNLLFLSFILPFSLSVLGSSLRTTLVKDLYKTKNPKVLFFKNIHSKPSISKKKFVSNLSHSKKIHPFYRHRLKGLLANRHKTNHYYLPVDSEAIKSENATLIDPDTLAPIYYSKIFDITVDSGSSPSDLKMYHTVENWIGTPYKLGGSTHWGIDCSQFAKKVYESVSSSFIGQTCREIINRVQKIQQLELKPGDFVFFKIHGRSASHMGVYLGNNKFVHSSLSKGVTISNLNDPYFQRHFIAGGRASKDEIMEPFNFSN